MPYSSLGPFETKASAFCCISRGEAETHGFGAPFPGPFFRAGSAGLSAAFFLVSGHVFSSFPASKLAFLGGFPATFFFKLPASRPGRFYFVSSYVFILVLGS